MIDRVCVIGLGMASAVAWCASSAAAANVLPRVDPGMIHAEFAEANGRLEATLAVGAGSSFVEGDDASRPLALARYEGEEYSTNGGDASVLNDTYYGSRLGFLLNGFLFWDAAGGETIEIETVAISDGLRLYSGGMRMPGIIENAHTFDSILSAPGETFVYPGMMHHPWVVADALGDYEVTFRFTHRLANGDVGVFGSDEITVFYRAVPSPGGAMLWGVFGLVCARRR